MSGRQAPVSLQIGLTFSPLPSSGFHRRLLIPIDPGIDVDVSGEKARLRALMRARLAAVSAGEYTRLSQAVEERLWSLPSFAEAGSCLFYAAWRGEVETRSLMEAWIARGRMLVLPKVAGRDLVFLTVEDLGTLRPGYCGIPEPVGGVRVPPDALDVVLVPGLAFDPAGSRLGRGGGHYDRALGCLADRTARIGLAFEFQVVPALSRSPHDAVVDYVVTNARVLSRHGCCDGAAGRAGQR